MWVVGPGCPGLSMHSFSTEVSQQTSHAPAERKNACTTSAAEGRLSSSSIGAVAVTVAVGVGVVVVVVVVVFVVVVVLEIVCAVGVRGGVLLAMVLRVSTARAHDKSYWDELQCLIQLLAGDSASDLGSRSSDTRSLVYIQQVDSWPISP